MISFELTIPTASITETVPLCNVVQKRLDYVLYSKRVPRHGSNVTYLGSPEVQAKHILEIYDQSNSKSGNIVEYWNSAVETATGQNIVVPDESTLITNEWNYTADNTVVPLFYRHRFDEIVTTVSVTKTTNIGSTTLDPLYWKLNDAKTDIFIAEQNSYNELTGSYAIYYVHWINTAGASSTDILNAEPAFHEATIEDIDVLTGLLDETSYSYVISSVGPTFTYQMAVSDTFLFKTLTGTRIQLLEPNLDKVNDPWFIRVLNGQFTSTVGSTNYNYSIPEFEAQSFSPAYRYMWALAENGLKITPSLLKLQRENTAIDLSIGYHLNVLLYDKETGNLEQAITTNSLLHNTFVTNTDIKWDSTIIGDWDNIKGIIVLTQPVLLDRYQISCSYIYRAIEFEYVGLNLNPYLNPEVLNNRIVFYVVPDLDGTGDPALYYLFVNNNTIVRCSQIAGTVVPNLSETNTDGSYNNSTIVGALYDSIDPNSFTSLYPEYFVLAELNIGTFYNPFNVQKIDCRVQGGIIAEDSIEAAIRAQPKLAYSSPLAPDSGILWPRNASCVVKVPYEIHKDYGGELDDTMIRELVTKHMGAGEYPVIVLDGVIPMWGIDDSKQGVFGGPGAIVLCWHKEDPSYDFNVYYGVDPAGPWTLLEEVAGAEIDHELTVNSLTSGQIYYFYITAVKNSIEGPRSMVQGALCL